MPVQSNLVTLGKFELTVGNVAIPQLPTHKARALTAFLVSNRGRDIARERLLELFWGEFEPERAREGLRTALSSIRHALRAAHVDPDHVLRADKSAVRWLADTLVDAERFLELTKSDDFSNRWSAVKLYTGDFLESNYENWVVGERERISSAYETLLSRVVEQSNNVEAARLLLARNPYDETAYAALIDSELRANRPTVAAEVFARARAAMADISAEPSEAFEARFAGIPELTDATNAQVTIPFVARTAELQILERGFHERVGTDGFVALIVGEPGIGKTALLGRANQLARDAERRVLSIRCQDDQQPLSAWRSLYERLTGRKLENLAGTASDVATVVARDIVAAFGKPSVLFVDDAHALRGDSLETFVHVVRIALTGAHAVVATLRPEARGPIESALHGCPHELLTLGPLQRSDIETALILTVEADTPALAQALYDRSGGHPLFFISLLQSLVQKQALRRERGRWRVVRALDERLELPQDLRASIEARLRAAGDDAAVVACALALEPSATAEDLAGALNYAEPRVLDALDQLMGFGLIREAGSGAQFQFGHDVVREVSGTVLNPGRRVALHRAFARRFERVSTPEAALRLARHLRAAGMAIPAARAYLQAAQAASVRHAFHDAMEHCSDGMSAIERIDHDRECEVLLSQLYRVRAQSAAHAGEIAVAVDDADDAVRYARASTQALETANALVFRASLHGALADRTVQLTDALETAALARQMGQRQLSARAAVQSSAATRSAGAVDEAIALAREACSAARECDDAETLYAAYEELVKAQMYWWRFDDARRTLAESAAVAERVGASTQARWSCMKVVCDYLMERQQDAMNDLRSALRQIQVASEGGDTASVDYPLPLIAFTAQYLRGVLACARRAWVDALDEVARCRQFEAIVKLPRHGKAVAMLEIDGLLGRNAPGDADLAAALATTLPEASGRQGMFGWSNCPSLVHARVAARLHREDAHILLRSALDAVEENAHRMPLDADRMFARLADAAEESAETGIAERAWARHEYYRALRITAAGTAPGKNAPLYST
ncbi:MAG: ATP-binding protein [Vulcanimicrobiaceae bacterium]